MSTEAAAPAARESTRPQDATGRATTSESSGGRLPGEEGVWVFILGDLVVFALFFGTIVYTRGQDHAAFADGQAHLHRALGVLNTVVLLTSSLLVARGVRAVDGRGPGRAPLLFGLAVGCALVFCGVKAIEYTSLLSDGFNPGTSDFFLYYFIFTGIHLGHVVLGGTLLGFVARRARRAGPTERDVAFAETGASFWHLVDLLWIVLFSLLYLMN
jgi:nitric oxide reductase NorE protein